MQETQVQTLSGEDTLEEEMETHSRILAWEIPWTEAPRGLQSMGSQRVRHDLATERQQSLGSRWTRVRWQSQNKPASAEQNWKCDTALSLEMGGSIKPQVTKDSTQRALLRINSLILCLKGPDKAHLAPRTNYAKYLSVDIWKDSLCSVCKLRGWEMGLLIREDFVLIQALLLPRRMHAC